MTTPSPAEAVDLCDLSCAVAATIVSRHYSRTGNVHIFSDKLHSTLSVSSHDDNQP